jgi:hypothetical protein
MLIALAGMAQGVTIEEARKLYAGSMESKETCETAYARFAQVESTASPLLVGYKAAITVAMSKHQKVAKEKIAYFNTGKKMLEEAIGGDSDNVELKFIRYTIQVNCPPALKYNKNLDTDKAFIIDNLSSVKNASVRKKIKEYFLQSKHITAEEKQKINEI